jgi:hypothetical protein
MPYTALTPAFLLITAPLMGGGTPTLLGALGVLTIAVGLYVLNTSPAHVGFLDPFRAFSKERGSRLMFLSALTSAFAANLDLIALQNANAPFYLAIDSAGTALAMTVMVMVYAMTGRGERNLLTPKYHWRALAGYGAMSAATGFFHLVALIVIPYVPYVIAGKRTGAIFFTVGLGFVMAYVVKHRDFERERENVRFRLQGTFAIIVGMLMVILWGRR